MLTFPYSHEQFPSLHLNLRALHDDHSCNPPTLPPQMIIRAACIYANFSTSALASVDAQSFIGMNRQFNQFPVNLVY